MIRRLLEALGVASAPEALCACRQCRASRAALRVPSER